MSGPHDLGLQMDGGKFFTLLPGQIKSAGGRRSGIRIRIDCRSHRGEVACSTACMSLSMRSWPATSISSARVAACALCTQTIRRPVGRRARQERQHNSTQHTARRGVGVGVHPPRQGQAGSGDIHGYNEWSETASAPAPWQYSPLTTHPAWSQIKLPCCVVGGCPNTVPVQTACQSPNRAETGG